MRKITFEKCDRNILILSFGFMFLFGAFYCTMTASEIILEQTDNAELDGYGYISLALINLTMGVFSLIVPYLVKFVSFKISFAISSLSVILYTASFIYPVKWALYISSALVGCGSAVLLTLHGVYIDRFSKPNEVHRNFSIFNFILDINHIAGGLIYILIMTRMVDLSSTSRVYVITPYVLIAIIGFVILLLVKDSKKHENITVKNLQSVFIHTWEDAKICFTNRYYWAISLILVYSSCHLTLYEGILSTSLTHIERFGDSRKYMNGLVNLVAGIGSIIVSGLCAVTTNIQTPFGLTLSVASEILFLLTMLISIPDAAPSEFTNDLANDIFEPNIKIAMICVFLNGTSLGVWTIRIYSLTSKAFMNHTRAIVFGYAFIQTFECVTEMVLFYFGENLNIKFYYILLLVTGTVANIVYYISEREINKDIQKEVNRLDMMI